VNDTILNNRQKRLIEHLNKKDGLSRVALAKKLNLKGKASRITQIRDLNRLIAKGLVKTKGKARATKYYLVQKNPLLNYIDIDEYFQLETYEREARQKFNENIFKDLKNLYSKKEKMLWEKSASQIKERKKRLNLSIYQRELERFVIEFSWKSSQIEGNTYSLIETETLIKQNIQAKGHPKDEAIMILNHKKAFDFILKNKNRFKKISYSDVINVHYQLTKGLVAPGLRSQPVRITGTLYVPPSGKKKLDSLLKKIVKQVNNLSYTPEKALVISVMLAYLQPFADGNKRSSRMLANAILISSGYFPLSYRNIDVNEYRRAMILFYEQNSLYHFKRLFLEQLNFATNNYFK
jgi:Fic family protein